ncbi:deoxyribodipyrimidine photo-lyase [Nitrospirillum sp. BR 11163]|uniref:deoxyribodipyrimidine photo-lyase n=1 Tax=Nitrospirillum sp. BR 11163 TaxID=3104323 RepID=UPI002AFEFF81|nr:deoxyribodipyrimidine photo-lyase [Nitrospirillum sp. BR 11163]MEA1675767.1 deoxyribodipyrimidine photo-lyase [Nitrospirillum sp. BR 11163]
MSAAPQAAIVVWFRQDLRLSDNPALTHAARSGLPVVPVYILDDQTPGPWAPGGASRWWLHHSLAALSQALAGLGCPLMLRRGRADVVLHTLVRETGAKAVVWNRCYEPHAVARDSALKAGLKAEGVAVDSFNSALLAEPWTVKTGTGAPYKVFTPFWKAVREGLDPGQPLAPPGHWPPCPPHRMATGWRTGGCCPPSPTGPTACAGPGHRARPVPISACGISWRGP